MPARARLGAAEAINSWRAIMGVGRRWTKRWLWGVAAWLTLASPALAQALDKVTFGTNWLAQAEHGGFYQAVAEGIYRKHGLDVTIKMGGPQVNGLQLLAAGQIDIFMGFDIQTMKVVEEGVPVVTIGATFQRDPVALIAHPPASSIEDLKGRPIFIGAASNTTFWPWLRAR
ncbi:MAG: ABC transporter substrate-binding protein, partial [Myxococcota bacterium]|nr:ABC transporter substrate-binding protein [Myxococcota bacterium]